MFADWTQKRRCGSSEDYRVEPGNDIFGEIMNAIVDAALRSGLRACSW